jgi:hypothetical protein
MLKATNKTCTPTNQFSNYPISTPFIHNQNKEIVEMESTSRHFMIKLISLNGTFKHFKTLLLLSTNAFHSLRQPVTLAVGHSIGMWNLDKPGKLKRKFVRGEIKPVFTAAAHTRNVAMWNMM